MKSMCRIVCGALLSLPLFYSAYRTHFEALALSDKAAGVKPPGDAPQVIERRERERHMTDDEKRAARRSAPNRIKEDIEFFGSDERDEVIERAGGPLLQQAIELDQQALMIALLGLALIGWGLWPVFGPVVRERRPEREPTAVEARDGEHSIAPRRGDGTEQGDPGHLPEPPAAGGIPGRDGGNLLGGEGGTGSL